MSSPSSNNEGDDTWLMKIELKREEPMEINKDEGIKKAMEDQVSATKDTLQLDHNLLTPTKIEAFKMIELARIQNKYLTRENILLKEHITALKGIIRKLEDLLRSMCDTTSSTAPSSPPPKKEELSIWVWALHLATAKLGGVPRYRITITFIFTVFLSSILLVIF